MTTSAAELVREARVILLDFDGPITPLMPPPANRQAADAAREALPVLRVPTPADVAETTDHLAVLRWAGSQGPTALDPVEKACIEAEVSAARTSAATPGALDFLEACAATDRQVVIVSNNSADAIHTFLNRFQAHRLVRGVVGRQPHRPDLLKPHPSLVLAALDVAQCDPAGAVLIGDSVSDIEVAHASGVGAIGYAKTARRHEGLMAAGADAVIAAMGRLAQALTE